MNGGIVAPGMLTDSQVLDELRALEIEARARFSRALDLTAEIEHRELAAQHGFRSTARLLGSILHLSRADARSRVDLAAQLGARRGLTGSLPPLAPVAAAALASGEIGASHVRVITAILDQLPTTATIAQRDRAESDLTDHARQFGPSELHRIGHRLLVHLDPDGPEPSEASAVDSSGELHLRPRRDGGITLDGRLDAEAAAIVRGVLDQLGTPAGADDARTEAHRRADALVEACALAAGVAPDAAGERPHLSVLIHYDDLRHGIGAATLDTAAVLDPATVRRLACDARVIPIVLGAGGEPLDVGRSRRTATPAIRRALVARDRCCTFPGCDRSPARCDAHHLREWVDGGSTSVDNMALLCPTHHRFVHRTGWNGRLRHGRVEFAPPAIIDRDRRPLTNPLRC